MEPAKATCYCLSCEYVLDGLSEYRCPECGRRFDPDDANTYWDGQRRSLPDRIARAAGRAVVSPPFVVLLMWANLVVPLCLPVAVPLALVSVGRNVARRRWIWATVTVVLCLSPFGYHFTCAVADYCRGTATLRYMGLPGTEFHNIDSKYRCERSTGGCVIRGAEQINDACYNAGVKSMISLLGPMPGAYLGPYPTKREALASLNNAEAIDLDALLSDQVRWSSGKFNLDTGVGAGILRGKTWQWAFEDKPLLEDLITEVGPLKAAMCQGCLVLRVPSYIHAYRHGEPSAMIVVIDSATGRPFAYYGEGDYSHHSPPVRWRE